MTSPETDLNAERALNKRFLFLTTVTGGLTFAADMSRLEEYVRRCIDTFAVMGVEFTGEDTEHLRGALSGQIEQALLDPSLVFIIISYEIPQNHVVNYHVVAASQTPTAAAGEMLFPAVPSMLEEYVRLCLDTFAVLGVSFSEEETAHLRGVLHGQLDAAFAESSRSNVVVAYQMPTSTSVNYTVAGQWRTIEAAYDHWVATRTPPLFGTEPDARVWNLSAESDYLAAYPILDIGAGTGRNSLALARSGRQVDAVEMSQGFAGILHEEAEKQGLGNLRVIPTEVSVAEEYMHEQYGLILLSEVVSDFRTIEQVRAVFELAERRLVPGGVLVFNAFLSKPEYNLTEPARQFGQFAYTSIFTRDEIEGAASGLGLDLVSDESVVDYEQAHLPTESWPPTSWYENWTKGMDVFDTGDRETCPIDMRWLVYRRRG